MNCPSHPRSEVVGYCHVCGAFGCAECLTRHQGEFYCQRHYRAVQQQAEASRKQDDGGRRRTRQRLVVRYADGRLSYGYCLALNPKDNTFYLETVDPKTHVASGESAQVKFHDLKAVFFVKSFDGNFDKTARQREWTPEGNELVVEFRDGEVIQGSSLHRYDPDDPRFHLIPDDPNGNNISVLIETAAVKGVYTPEEFKALRAREREQLKESGKSDLSQEETLGDFYFDTRNYPVALQQYEAAFKNAPQSTRLRKKILATEYNIGVGCVKARDFSGAMVWMQKVLKADPDNAHAKKKVGQLRKILEGGSRAEAGNKD